MHPRLFHELARQRHADMLRHADMQRRAAGLGRVSTGARHVRHTRDASRSLRTRAGWWLVEFGLKLAVRPDSRRAASPRPAGS